MDKKVVYNRRWINYFINPRFQLSILLFNLLILASALGIVYYQINKSFWVLETYARAMEGDRREIYNKVIQVHQEFAMDAVISAGIFCLVLILIFNLVFTHKSEGAIYRLKNYFKDICDNGYHQDLNFREGDMHQELPEIVNEALRKIKEGKAD